jgi:predicted O-methyltransferase YrrM
MGDIDGWGVSMANAGELLAAVLDAAGVRSVIEVGAYAGDLTRFLLDWAEGAGATVKAVDPAPQPALVELGERPELELIRETSLEALPRLTADAVVLDGDHNYETVLAELRLLDPVPLVLLHDVCWPHARRDDYFDVAIARHELVPDGHGIVPWDEGSVEGGLPYPRSAAREGGARNGVLTAVEDWAAERGDVRLAVVPVFFGIGVAWPQDAPWAEAVEAVVAPLDRHPVVARLEANRVHNLARGAMLQAEVWALQERVARQEAVLRRLLDSSAFGVAERLSALRVRAGVATGASAVSRDELRRALDAAG